MGGWTVQRPVCNVLSIWSQNREGFVKAGYITQTSPFRSTPSLSSSRWSCVFFTGRVRGTRRLVRRLNYRKAVNDSNIDYFLLQLLPYCVVFVRRLPGPSRPMHFRDVSETNGPRDRKSIGRGE